MDVTIESVGRKGDGIAKKNGFVLFVPNTNKGDHVRIRVTKVLGSAGFAEVIEKAEKKKQSREEEDELLEATEDTEDFGEE
ncbi:TRAM domain-containing protein [Candidatus Woesearchaeota archaeon]|nr:TRAM domain-containing protein [Candidatus Woesearchaeota archaeon]